MDEKLGLNDELFDSILDGGFEKGVISVVYGPASSGKTTVCSLASIATVNSGRKVIYIDTENGFSTTRLSQLSRNYEKILDNILFFNPSSFEEQEKIFFRLESIVNEKIGLIVLDTASFHYRVEIAKRKNIKELNNSIISQISKLKQFAVELNIPVIITSQVYSSFDEKNKINIVGGDIIKFASKCMIELNIDSERIAILKKHRSLPETSKKFRIVGDGFEIR